MTELLVNRPALTVAVLAGGASKRMGQDKALMCAPGNRSLLALVCTAARDSSLPVIIVGRTNDHLPPDMPAGCVSVPDLLPGCGPLGGLATAFAHAPNADVLLCACDLPYITADCFTWMIEQHRTLPAPYDGLLPRWQGKAQPLFALYRQSVVTAARHLLETGSFAMKNLYSRTNILQIDLPESLAGAVTDWDSPADVNLPQC